MFWHPLCCKIPKQMKGDPLVQSKKVQKVSVPKKSGAMGEPVFEAVDVCFVYSFRFGRASEVGVVEVWNCWGLTLLNKWTKKVDLTRLKNTTHCNSRARFLLKSLIKNGSIPNRLFSSANAWELLRLNGSWKNQLIVSRTIVFFLT